MDLANETKPTAHNVSNRVENGIMRPGMDLSGTLDIVSHSGTVPGNPGHLVTLLPAKNNV